MTSIPAIGMASTPLGQIACARCGLPTTGEAVVLDVFGRVQALDRIQEMRGKVTFGLCSTCRDREALARTLLAEHPRVHRAIGSPALHLVTGALDALAMLDAQPPAVLTDARLSAIGVAARWSSRYSPIWSQDASAKECASQAWLFVSTEHRKEATHLYADWQADGLPPILVASPSGGCAWCGVGSVPARRSQKRIVWRSVGKGHLCPTCSTARENGDGPAHAVWEVLDADHAIRRRFAQRPQITGLVLWSETRGTPNAEPWGHLDLASLRRAWAPAPKSAPRTVYLDANASV